MSETQTMAIFQKLTRNALGRLVLTDLQGQEHRDISVVRAHPISAPDEGISLLGSDGHELAWIDRLSDLPAPERELLTAELASREFVPMIQRIKEVSTYSTPSQWTVETDRGETRFILKTEEDIRRLGEGRLLISSSHGLQLMVQDRFALDRPSKKILERFL